ncbi:MAG: TIM barrel protein [Planctomycetaceae bacterium]
MTRNSSISRRSMISSLGVAGAAAMGGLETQGAPSQKSRDAVPEDFRIQNRRIRQAVMGWCFKPMPAEDLIRHAVAIGIEGIEGIPTSAYPTAVQAGLKISMVSSHGFGTGPADPANHDECIAKLKSSIDTSAEFGRPVVITFTGMRVDGMPDDVAEANCLACWRKAIDYAEKKEVTLVLEHLNSRDNTHPMKGHPGYFGDDVERCVRLVREMNSPHFKLLFDIYHVQIMNGDVIRRLKMYHDYIGHYHTAGNPGRCELDENQEINYPAIMKAILETGYNGFVCQEFIPTWDDPVLALRHAASVCDV